MRTRRSLLGAVGSIGVVALAGCSGGDSSGGSTPTGGTTATDGATPDGPTESGEGATGTPGTWQSLDGGPGNTSANTAASGPASSPTLRTVYDQPTVENILSAPVVEDETVVFVDEANIRAVSLTGDQRWQFGWSGEQSPLPTPALRNGTVYFPTTDALIAIADGKSEWTADLPGQPLSSPIVTADGVYLLTGGEQYTIVAYDYDGNQRYTLSPGDPLSRPSVDGSTLYHYRDREYDESQLVARNVASGGVRWTNSGFKTSAGPVAADEMIYCVRQGSYGDLIVALSRDNGTVQWVSDSLTDTVVGSPAVTGETLYVGTTEGIHALGTDDGSTVWDETYATDATVTGQVRVDGRSVYLAQGDTAVAIDRASGDQRWSTTFGTDGDPGVYGIAPIGDSVYATLQRRIVALE